MEEQETSLSLLAPQALTLSAAHPGGPWARRMRREIRSRSGPFFLVNIGTAPIAALTLNVDPLAREEDGSRAEADFRLLLEGEPIAQITQLAPGKAVSLQIEAYGRLPPGRYLSALRIADPATGKARSIPITVTISAHWLWVIGFILLGLIFLGLSGVLGGEAEVQEKQGEILSLRENVHEFLEHHPALANDREVAVLEEDFTRALETLSGRRSWALKDRRLSEAERYRRQIEERFERLRAASEGKAEGVGEAERLEKEWEGLRASVAAAKALLQVRETGSGGDWPQLLRRFAQEQRHLLLDLPIQAVEEEMGQEVDLVRLALATGEGSRTRQLAVKTRDSLRRAARLFEGSVRLVFAFRLFATETALRQAALNRMQGDPRLPAAARRELAGLLQAARGALARGMTLVHFQESYTGLQAAETYALEAWSKTVIEMLQAAAAEAKAQAVPASVQQALSRLSPGDPPSAKKENLLAITDLWRKEIAVIEDPAAHKDLLDLVESLERQIAAGDLDGAAPEFKRLLERWSAYQEARWQKTRQAVLLPFCALLERGLAVQLSVAQQTLVLLEPDPRVAGLDNELDRVRLGLARLSQDKCLEELTDLHGRLVKAGDKMMAAAIMAYGGSPQARLAAAERSGSGEAIALARQLMTEPRRLQVTPLTAPQERYVGRQLNLEIGDLDPVWGAGVEIAVDFGDGTPLLRLTAEQVRQGARVSHRYQRPQSAAVRAIATSDVTPDLLQPVGAPLGVGEVVLDIRPSPVRAAQAMADRFFNLRFALALMIALLVQGWRFYGTRPFGAQGRDYIEAFALGLGINVGIEGLAEVLEKLGAP